MRSRVLLLVLPALAAVAVLAAGCGSGGSPGAATGASSTSAATAAQTGALAFARCMRAHGIPGWPDPGGDGHFDKAALRALDVSPVRMRSIQDRFCQNQLPASSGPTITAADRADYLRAAACMRRHGYPGFPDPVFADGEARVSVPATIDQDSPRFKGAAEICTRLIPAGLPYSHPPGS